MCAQMQKKKKDALACFSRSQRAVQFRYFTTCIQKTDSKYLWAWASKGFFSSEGQ